MDLACNLNFTLNLMDQLSGSATFPILVSPLSLLMALTMAYSGAQGETLAEFKRLFCIKKDGFHSFRSRLHEAGRSAEIYNIGFVGKNLQLTESFKTLHKTATWKSVDFEDKTAPHLINAIVSNKTRGRIPDLIHQIDPNTRLILVNTIFFHQFWNHGFPFENIRIEGFHLSAEKEEQVKMMTGLSYGNFAENQWLEAARINLGYDEPEAHFLVFRPKQRFGLSNAFKTIDKAMIDQLLEYSHTKVNLTIPRFRFQYESNTSEILQDLGLSKGFSPEADFSQITHEPLQINQVTETYVDAAAATATMFLKQSLMVYRDKPRIIQMYIDEPFLYMIVSQSSDILFAGIYSGPN